VNDSYEIVRVANGEWSVRCLEHKETFHPVIGPAAEAEALYVRQLRLPERIANTTEPFVIWDVGLGAAANPLTLLRSVQTLRCEIRIISFDRTSGPLQFALQHPAQLPFVRGFEAWMKTLAENGMVKFEMEGGPKVYWEFHLADFPTCIQDRKMDSLPKPHAIFYDAFSPRKNPSMWTLPLFTRLHALLNPDRECALATYSRSTLLRVTLLLAGFYVGAGHATGEKEETTIASNSLKTLEEPLGFGWLERARRSTSAEPLHQPEYQQSPLSKQSWDLLLSHPQFIGLNSSQDLTARAD
jgi:tRNA U34 5-methylaminomethyl-2-thiouridine-forming methyltransferase MnmC